jgi:hypothetical protein
MLKKMAFVFVIGCLFVLAGCGSKSDSSIVPAGMQQTHLSQAQIDAVNAHMAKLHGGN